MKIRIKEFRGEYACRGFWPRAGLRIAQGEEFEYDEGEDVLYEQALATGLVEDVPKIKTRGRPKKNESEADANNAHTR